MPLPERGGDCPLCLPRWKLLARLLGLLMPYRLAASALMALTFATVAVQLSTPYITKMIVDEVIKGQHPDRLGLWIGAMAATAVLLLAIRSANRSLACWLGGRLVDGLPCLLVNLISFAAIAGILLHLDRKLAQGPPPVRHQGRRGPDPLPRAPLDPAEFPRRPL
jgi:hypothetical protein